MFSGLSRTRGSLLKTQRRKREFNQVCSALSYNSGMESVRPRRPMARSRARESTRWNGRGRCR